MNKEKFVDELTEYVDGELTHVMYDAALASVLDEAGDLLGDPDEFDVVAERTITAERIISDVIDNFMIDHIHVLVESMRYELDRQMGDF